MIVPQRDHFVLSGLIREIRFILCRRESRRTSLLLLINLFALVFIRQWVMQGYRGPRLLTLQTLFAISYFQVLTLLGAYLTLWVGLKSTQRLTSSNRKRNSDFHLGNAKYEIWLIFCSSFLFQLYSIWMIKEAFETLILTQPPSESHNHHINRTPLGAASLLVSLQLLNVYLTPKGCFHHVYQIASSQWVQDGHRILSRFFGEVGAQQDPLVLLSIIAFGINVFVTTIGYLDDPVQYDSIVSMIVPILVFTAYTPVSKYTGRIIAKSASLHDIPQLEFVLGDALAVEGVLEFRDERFWTVSFGRLAGSLTMRLRKDADERLALDRISAKLSSLVRPLTVQIDREENTPVSSPPIYRSPVGNGNGGGAIFTSTPKENNGEDEEEQAESKSTKHAISFDTIPAISRAGNGHHLRSGIASMVNLQKKENAWRF